MNGFLENVFARGRMTITSAILLAVAGMMAWQQMPRQEDPNMPDYWGNVVTIFPGADAETVERLILLPLEEHLAEVEEIANIKSTAMNEQAIVEIELRAGTDNIIEVWDDVEDALRDARDEFPEGALSPELNEKLNDQESVVLAVTGSGDPLALEQGAERLKDALLALSEVAEVRLIGEPEEQITIAIDDARAKRLGLDSRQIAAALGARTRNIPGGSIQLTGRSVNLKPNADFRSLEEIRSTPIMLPSGVGVPLSEVASVSHGPREPARGYMRFNGQRAVGLGIIPRDQVHLEAFGEAVRLRTAEITTTIAPLEVSYLTYQPARVTKRLDNLGQSLLMGIAIVAGILLLFMGPRLGIVVASVLPLVAMSSLALFAFAGGKLHQMSISALVIALGMLVDNAIVMAEAVQWRIDKGESPTKAALGAVRELAIPLASATATTLAAFVPMLMAPGVTADFTRDLPIVIMLTLSMSYIFAVLITPKLGSMFLRQRKQAGEKTLGGSLANLVLRRPGLILGASVFVVCATVLVSGNIKQQFFPASDRNQILVEIKLPEGTHLDTTDDAARAVERALMGHEAVQSVAGFVGRSAPHFYYNVSQIPWSPHFAQILVNTANVEVLPEVIDHVRTFAAAELPQYQVIPRRLEQGPPVENPVEVRLSGADLDTLSNAADQVLARLRTIPGTVDARHDMSLGAPAISFDIDDAAAARAGVSRADVAGILYGRTRGLSVGQYRGGDDPIPVLLRSSQGERLTADDLEVIEVGPIGGKSVPVAQLASLSLDIRPAAIKHRDGVRVVTVSSQLEDGVTFSQVMTHLAPVMAEITLPEGIEYSFGGLGEGSAEANGNMALALPVGLILLFGILLLEFNSFRKVGIVFTTVPLAATGVIPGLLLSGQPFGFMSLLGVISLIGIVVNNAIVLLDVIDSGQADGLSMNDAVSAAIQRRTRPILLTTTTTVAGLLPLALGGSSLWPPLAWAIISGLIASTALTLLVVPALYLVLFRPRARREKRMSVKPIVATATLVMLGLLAFVPQARAGEMQMTLDEAMNSASKRGLARASLASASAANEVARGEKRAAWLPEVGMEANHTYRDEAIELSTPAGSFQLGEKQSDTADVQLVQPIFRPAQQRFVAPAAASDAAAERFNSDRTLRQLKAEAASAYLDLVAVDANLQATKRFIESLEARLKETQERVRLGRVLEVDVLKLKLSLDGAKQDHRALLARQRVAAYRLGRAVGLNQPVFPKGEASIATPLPSQEEAIQQAETGRTDLRSLEEQIRAAELRVRAVGAQYLPNVDAVARYGWAQDDPFRDGSNVEGALRVSWRPFAGGKRKPQQAAARLQVQALQAQLEEQRSAIALDVISAFAGLDTSQGALDVATSSVTLAEETLRVERERHEAGRVTTNDLLDAEVALWDQQMRKAVAQTDVTKAKVAVLLASGRL